MHKGYRCYENSTKSIFISRHVILEEPTFPFCKCISSSPLHNEDTVLLPLSDYPLAHSDQATTSDPPQSPTTSEPEPEPIIDTSEPTHPHVHQMVTRSQLGIVKPKYLPDYVTHYTITHPLHFAFTSNITSTS